ncbi:esterase/lipase family protein [Roseateles koreensis]|uniref:Alpha/beta hydrolase n=1 Tax=Roseateles koreensis TaxID=2987526 RepID=A0ABT5KM76_9BURK|nr:alpha/beta hydrolase [Roseateles koreensis]MDC8784008.1 alpha/beta hydrolase [Roseateles koreensis]
MNTNSPRQRHRHWHPSDLRGIGQMAVQAAAGLTRIVEGVHQSVHERLGLSSAEAQGSGRTTGITGSVYRGIDGVTQLVGQGLDKMLRGMEPWLAKSLLGDATGQPPLGSPEREALLAALNGVMGDHLQASHNPLATPMSLRWQNQALARGTHWPQAADVSPRVLLMLHGLCMNDLQWQPSPARAEHAAQGSHVAALCQPASLMPLTPLSLRYNSGLHISENGALLATLLEDTLAHWPVPLEQLDVLAHSMGGLLIRSAWHQAQAQGMRWPRKLKRIVFLGTPHHGAPLERAGNWIDMVLGSTTHTAPLAKLGQLRSAGITDLRHGNLLAQDWQGRDRFHPNPDAREHLPLPEGVDCYVVAATLAAKRGVLAERLIGDGLVPLHSALGLHDDPARCLHFAPEHQWIAYRMNHMALLHSPLVTRKLLEWLR